MDSPAASSRSRLAVLLLTVGALGLALAPWLRNHGYLRDFYDYGLMMRASGRIADGARPFVDFTSAQQSLTLALNAAAEHLGNGTFAAMTWGNAGLIALGFLVLAGALARRLPAPAAILLALGIVVGSAGQHTIIWYNATGVLLLAGAVIAAAAAPTLSRHHWGWNALTLLALVASGTNKLNFHAVALVGACAWPLRAALLREASWSRALTTLVTWLLAGTLVPLALELAWTGASWSQWLQNVVVTPASSRSGLLAGLLVPTTYLRPAHDHYGSVFGPVGLVVGLWAFALMIVGWRQRAGRDRLLLIAACGFAVITTAALLLTNVEIIYVAAAAAIALFSAIWLGFGLPQRGIEPLLGLGLPTLFLGALMWSAAWQGQRALFGSTPGDRADFRPLAADSAPARYLGGTRIPSPTASDLEALAEIMPAAPADTRLPYFYGAGVEWLDRVWPAQSFRQLPLLNSATAMGPAAVDHLRSLLTPPSPIQRSIGVTNWMWPGQMKTYLRHNTDHRLIGGIEIFDHHDLTLPSPLSRAGDTIHLFNLFGGTVDPACISIDPDAPLLALGVGAGRTILGVVRGQGRFSLTRPSQRIRGSVVVQRIPADVAPAAPPLRARFRITNDRAPPEAVVWETTVSLAPGATEQELTYDLELGGQPAHFEVSLPAASDTRIRAGWRLPHILAAGADTLRPPRLREPAAADETMPAQARADLMPADWVDQSEVVLRQGRWHDGQLQVARGGELWFRLDGGESPFVVKFENPIPAGPDRPVIRFVWYKGGRLEMLTQNNVADVTGLVFQAWKPEAGGWFGVLVDPGAPERWVSVSLDQVEP